MYIKANLSTYLWLKTIFIVIYLYNKSLSNVYIKEEEIKSLNKRLDL
jgi:hypothetical protein